jgi:uncharacterized membrane protein
MPATSARPSVTARLSAHPIGRRVLRGVGLILPPLLTIVIFVWIGSTVQTYVLAPVQQGAEDLLAWALTDVRDRPPEADPDQAVIAIDGRPYMRLESGQYIPAYVGQWLESRLPAERVPASGAAAWRRYIQARHMQPHVVVPVFLLVFVLILYLLGKFLAASVANLVERAVYRLPLVRSVYASVKQITDFVFVESKIQYKRVVAVQYPRKGIWTVGLVTGEGLGDVSAAANEPCLTVMLPCSPMPVTGYAVTVPRSDVRDLDVTIDQALQFIISCGVVVPPHQSPRLMASADDQAAADGLVLSPDDGEPSTPAAPSVGQEVRP